MTDVVDRQLVILVLAQARICVFQSTASWRRDKADPAGNKEMPKNGDQAYLDRSSRKRGKPHPDPTQQYKGIEEYRGATLN